MIRRTVTALLVALVASFVLTSPVSAASKKTARPRPKHASHATTGSAKTKPTVKKKRVTRKKTAAKVSVSAKKSNKTRSKRTPATKPH
jgi:hypothetical protein